MTDTKALICSSIEDKVGFLADIYHFGRKPHRDRKIVSVRATASGAVATSGGEVEACWHQAGIAGTGAGRKRIS